VVYCSKKKSKTSALKQNIVGMQVQTEAKIKEVAPKAKAYFVGKLDSNTSEDDLTTFLPDHGITVEFCKPLQRKEE